MSITYIPSTRHLTLNNLVTKIKIEYIPMKKSTPDHRTYIRYYTNLIIIIIIY
jgi:hypothetical protein